MNREVKQYLLDKLDTWRFDQYARGEVLQPDGRTCAVGHFLRESGVPERNLRRSATGESQMRRLFNITASIVHKINALNDRSRVEKWDWDSTTGYFTVRNENAFTTLKRDIREYIEEL